MPYLTEALASLEAQTCRDFEVCLWDNGSTDGSVEEARRWIPGRLPGRVVTGHPLPLHECLAKMVEEARTEFVARMDGDDVCLPVRFQMQLEAMRGDPKLGIVGGQCPMMDSGGNPSGNSHPGPLEHEDIVTEMMFRSALTHPALMFRREAILGAGNYQQSKPVEDLDLYLRMARFCRFRNLSNEVLRYRIHPQSICQSDLEGQQKQVLEVVANYSKAIFGISNDEFLALRARRSKCAMVLFLKSAAYRARGSLGRFLRITCSPSFIFVARCMTAQNDLLSKTSYRLLESGSGFFAKTKPI
jgi:GT2 family glycosyltransferase